MTVVELAICTLDESSKKRLRASALVAAHAWPRIWPGPGPGLGAARPRKSMFLTGLPSIDHVFVLRAIPVLTDHFQSVSLSFSFVSFVVLVAISSPSFFAFSLLQFSPLFIQIHSLLSVYMYIVSLSKVRKAYTKS